MSDPEWDLPAILMHSMQRRLQACEAVQGIQAQC